MRYEKPMVLPSSELTEGVFTASGNVGSGCYSVAAYITQKPEEGRNDYRIQVDAHHLADHSNDKQVLMISFNQPVIHLNGGVCAQGNGTNTLVIEYFYHQNPTDNIGLNDLIVMSDPGLEITGVSMTD